MQNSSYHFSQLLREGGHINKSLLALGSVIAKLSEGERKEHRSSHSEELQHLKDSLLRDTNSDMDQQRGIEKMKAERRETICIQAQQRCLLVTMSMKSGTWHENSRQSWTKVLSKFSNWKES
ncbi:PREDICTED: uncharacterized protein LOC107343636 isoform X2 [Acropora digitifera]|uniref:uncharacterized protein LOC107343636 isoform X2 n=1 Tax=Acropora digitifera TaxID=70779 RepID=UPI00077B0EFF|nr:PREDICTED: uncharacterized protein LOC107343636 isoform X2 [Acropora digitifera]